MGQHGGAAGDWRHIVEHIVFPPSRGGCYHLRIA